MKTKILVLLSVSILVTMLPNIREIHSNVAGAPEGYSGSPTDGQNCLACHDDGSTIIQPGMITSNIPVEGYLPDSTYSLTATVTKTGVSKFGFEISPQGTTGAFIGTLLANPATTQLVGNGKYITHIATSTSGSGTQTWTFNWKAPKPSAGKVTFYGAFNAADNNGSYSGDQIYTSKLEAKDTVTVKDTNNSINESISMNTRVNLFPNPGKGNINLDISSAQGGVYDFRISNITGKLIYNEVLKIPAGQTLKNLALDDIENGMYIIHLVSDKGVIRKPFMVVE